MHNIVLYIDGDNQSPLLFEDLYKKISTKFKSFNLKVFLFSNGSSILNSWETTIQKFVENIISVKTPIIKNSSDTTLILTIGMNLKDHKENEDIIIVMSRDSLLIDFVSMLINQEVFKETYITFDANIDLNQVSINKYIIRLNTKDKLDPTINIHDVAKDIIFNYNNKCLQNYLCNRLNKLGFSKSQIRKVLRSEYIVKNNDTNHVYLSLAN